MGCEVGLTDQGREIQKPSFQALLVGESRNCRLCISILLRHITSKRRRRSDSRRGRTQCSPSQEHTSTRTSQTVRGCSYTLITRKRLKKYFQCNTNTNTVQHQGRAPRFLMLETESVYIITGKEKTTDQSFFAASESSARSSDSLSSTAVQPAGRLACPQNELTC